MVNVEFVSQLIHSMDDAVIKLERSIIDNKVSDANKLRTFIFDLHKQIEGAIVDKDV